MSDDQRIATLEHQVKVLSNYLKVVVSNTGSTIAATQLEIDLGKATRPCRKWFQR